MKISASRSVLAIALAGAAAALAGCNPPDLASYDPHAKFAAEVQKKTGVMFLGPAGSGAGRMGAGRGNAARQAAQTGGS